SDKKDSDKKDSDKKDSDKKDSDKKDSDKSDKNESDKKDSDKSDKKESKKSKKDSEDNGKSSRSEKNRQRRELRLGENDSAMRLSTGTDGMVRLDDEGDNKDNKDENKDSDNKDSSKDSSDDKDKDKKDSDSDKDDKKDDDKSDKKEKPSKIKSARGASGVSTSSSSSDKASEGASTESFKYAWETNKLKDGNYILKFILDDRLSNPEDHHRTINVRAVTVDNTAPEIELIECKRKSNNKVECKVVAKDKTSPIVNAMFRFDEGDYFAFGASSNTSDGLSTTLIASDVNCASGAKKIEIKVSDRAGNTTSKSASIK
ncbi:MAG: hypothetical protein K2Z81_17550, partial [Cyanobacteria bacterium]|nr:hypothetical protein [Cyanobacteriota bacterium]